MATPVSLTTRNEAAVLQADVPVYLFDPVHFEAHLENHADWAELIEIVHSANDLVRLARALLPAE